MGRGGRSLVGGVGWLCRVRLVSGCSEAPQVPRRRTSRGWFAGLRPEGPVRGQTVGGELPQVDRGGSKVQRRVNFRNSAVADLAEPRGDPGDGPFDHRPVRPVGGPQRPVVSPPTAVCPLKLVMLVHRDAAASGGRGAQIRKRATGAGSPELRDPGLDGETDVSSVAKSAAPAAASPVPGPVALVNDTAVMIPVSGSATTCALKPSWRRSRILCACRVPGSTVEMTRSRGDLPGDLPPSATGCVRIVDPFHVLPGDQRQQRQRLLRCRRRTRNVPTRRTGPGRGVHLTRPVVP